MFKDVFFLALLFSQHCCFASEYISGDKARELVKKGAILLDVRTLVENKLNHLNGSRLIHYSEIQKVQNLKKIEKWSGGKKNHPIVVFCQSGGRASVAEASLIRAGYTRVYNLGPWHKYNQ